MLHGSDWESVVDDPKKTLFALPALQQHIRRALETPRRLAMEPASLGDLRLKVEKHIKNTYLKQVQAPVGVKPILKCWMEPN